MTRAGLWRRRWPSAGWGWVLQRVSAALLLFFLLAHLWVEHFMHLGQPITFQSVTTRLLHGFYLFVDGGLLAVVVFHGLNGLRNILLDLDPTPAATRTLTGILWGLGIVTVAFGVDILSPFVWGHPVFPL
jgi:succinate dehydrogenase / fumarate reductase membrane anchor subunit